MRIAMITEAFPPLRSSGAVQMRDLAREFARQGHEPVVLTPQAGLDVACRREFDGTVEVLRLRAPRTKDMPYWRRTLAELALPFRMGASLARADVAPSGFDGVVWYSPSIFLGPLARKLSRASECRSYLILRDIFPQWARDIGLMSAGLPYWLFSRVADYQYGVADTIGIQASGNRAFLEQRPAAARAQIEILQNWLGPAPMRSSPIDLSRTRLARRALFVYTGNLGVAQGVDKLIALVAALRDEREVGFVFVGRGSEVARMRERAHQRKLDNVLFFDEIDPDEIGSLYNQCDVGLLSLAGSHSTHNVPGKFVSYMHFGLPVLASVNLGNDLVGLIRSSEVGVVSVEPDGADLPALARSLIADRTRLAAMSDNARKLAASTFSAETAARQVVAALRPGPAGLSERP